MRVLWFTNIPMPGMLDAASKHYSGAGSWMVALLERLVSVLDIELAVACVWPGLADAEIVKSEKLRFYPINQGPAWRLFAFSHPDDDMRYLQRCVDVIDQVKPDVIHIHGTERFYGLLGARRMTAVPCVISLQGLIHDYSRFRNYFGVVPLKEIVSLHDLFHLARGMGPIFDYMRLQRVAKREMEILKGNRWFMGRTMYDRAHVMAINPTAHYFYAPEMLRPMFYHAQWNLDSCQRHRIIFTNAGGFGRGTEIILEAVAILKQEFPDIHLALAGGVEKLPYGKRLKRRIAWLGIQDQVEFLGRLTETQMVAELCQAHVFAIASLLENSSNSLCEAQMVGLPCVTSYVGGIPSLVEEGQTGLFFPSADAPILAERIREIFVNDDLARTLGARARRVALVRHDPELVVQKVLEAYEMVIREQDEIPYFEPS
jgi:glycosyltransferase involved in cell wall biosynthesis